MIKENEFQKLFLANTMEMYGTFYGQDILVKIFNTETFENHSQC